MPHVLTSLAIADVSRIHVVHPRDAANPNWLRPGIPSAGQQEFGDALLGQHPFVLIPSAISTHSWNPLFVRTTPSGAYALRSQERFALDARLHPPG